MSYFAKVCEQMGIPCVVEEHKFHPTRRWRIDYAIVEDDVKIAIELEGGVWSNGGLGGRHNRGKGFIGDMEKYNALIEHGWSLLRYQPEHIDYDQIKRVYNTLKKSVNFTKVTKV